MDRLVVLMGAILVLTGIVAPAWAQDADWRPHSTAATANDDFDRNVFFFTGRFHRGYFGQSVMPWQTTFENNYIIAAGYQQFFARFGALKFGGEIGLADRFTTDANTSYPGNSQELWTGIVVRYDGFNLGPVHITPALTAGFSVVTGLIGIEYDRRPSPDNDRLSGGGTFLYYLGPEIDFSLPEVNPGVEVFLRAQHRSGGFGTIAHIDGANADVVGIRYKF
jgi:hypothetical protein